MQPSLWRDILSDALVWQKLVQSFSTFFVPATSFIRIAIISKLQIQVVCGFNLALQASFNPNKYIVLILVLV